MTARIIKNFISPGVWVPHCGLNIMAGNTTIINATSSYTSSPDTDKANMVDICNAMTNTYQSGIDPECVPEMVKMMESMFNKLNWAADEFDSDILYGMSKDLRALLTKAKIQQ